MSDHSVLRTSEFDSSVKKYYLVQPIIVLTLTIIGIPFIPLVLLITFFFLDKYLASLECTLTERTLEIKRGIFNRVESTIPLEKITDLQMYQGPIMRMFGLHGFKVETAGQSATATGSLVNMLGIKDTPGFRKAVLDQRDRLAASQGAPASQAPSDQPAADDATALIAEIRDALLRIENKLDQSP